MAKKKESPLADQQPKGDLKDQVFRVECLDELHINAVRACMIASIGNLTLGFVHPNFEGEPLEQLTAKENTADFYEYLNTKQVSQFRVKKSFNLNECNMLVTIDPVPFEAEHFKFRTKDQCWNEEVRYLGEAKQFWAALENEGKEPKLRDPKNDQLRVCLELLKTAAKRLNFSTIDVREVITVSEAIAKLGKYKQVRAEHVAEAIGYSKKSLLYLQDNRFYEGD